MKCRGHAVPHKALLKKKTKLNFAVHNAVANFSKCPPLDCKIKPFFNGV